MGYMPSIPAPMAPMPAPMPSIPAPMTSIPAPALAALFASSFSDWFSSTLFNNALVSSAVSSYSVGSSRALEYDPTIHRK